jgi:hypothetical protein
VVGSTYKTMTAKETLAARLARLAPVRLARWTAAHAAANTRAERNAISAMIAEIKRTLPAADDAPPPVMRYRMTVAQAKHTAHIAAELGVPHIAGKTFVDLTPEAAEQVAGSLDCPAYREQFSPEYATTRNGEPLPRGFAEIVEANANAAIDKAIAVLLS